MADGGVRKSSRIRSRGPMVYAEDDLDLAYDLHLDIANEIFSVLEPPSKQKSSRRPGARKNASANVAPTPQKNKGRSGTGRKTTSNLSKKVEEYSISKQHEVKASSANNKCVFNDAKVHAGGDNSANTREDCSSVSCSVCDTIFVSKKAMEDHMAESHSDEVKLQGYLMCDVCKQMCVNQSVYDKHMKLHSNGRKFKCELCKKAFADGCSLKRHMKSHDDERPYTCDLCMKSFRDNPSLSRHQRTHTDRPRMFNCLKCDKNFTDKHTLKRHERTHMSMRPFECETCSKTFCESGSFRRHLRTHSGVRSFICPVCSRSFLEKQSLLRHQKNVCGFVGDGKTNLPSFYNLDQGTTSRDSEANDSDISRTAVDEKSCVLNEATSSDEYLNAPKLTFSDVNKPALPGNSKRCELSEKSNGLLEPKDTPSLHSLIQKDPDLYNSISEIVESIDSYEKMLDLCGDTGQVEIDAALTREPVPMPENLMCFECGEQLVDGENFKAQGKSFHPSLCHSYKCFNCEDDDYGDPPVLTAEVRSDCSPLSVKEDCASNTTDDMLQRGLEEKLAPLRDSMSKNIFGTDESLEHLRERLKSQHGVLLFGHAYGDSHDEEEEESDMNDQTDNMSSVATSSRSHSIDSEATQIFVTSQDGASNPDPKESLDVNTSGLGCSQPDDLLKDSPGSSATSAGQEPSLSMTPKMDYEADDPSISSVFPCHLCTKVFASSSFLTRHLTLHKNSPHKCMVCSKTFTNSQNLKRHITTHTGEKPYTCPYCSKCFRDPSNFSKHKKACCASQSVPSPDDSSVSTSCVSSPQSVEASGPVSHPAAHVTDVKDKFSLPSCSAATDSSASQDIPLSFNYDNDEEEDLPVSFGHPPDSSGTSPTGKYLPDRSSQHGVNSVTFEASERLTPDKDVSSTRTRPDEGSVLVPCEICGKMLENMHLLEIHMKYHSSDPRVTCIECGKCFADPFGLKRHLRIHAGIRPHLCEYCGRGYCDNWSLRKHKSRGCMLQEVNVPADFLHPCPQCTRVFCESDFLEEHLKSHSGLLKFECDICQKRFSEAFNLKRHRRLHMAVCSSCDKEFKDVQSLNDHQAHECPVNIPGSTTGQEEGFSCQECGRVYSTKAYLERHKKFHLDLKPYVCEICSKRFAEAFRLRRHLKVHKGERPFSCEMGWKNFTDFSSLKRHLSNSSCSLSIEPHTPHGSGYFSCQLCDKTFTKNYLLARHMNVHSKDRPFTCDECGRTYKDTSSLKRHQLTHQGIKSFICPVCGKGFFYSDSLKRHLVSSCGKKAKPFHRRRGRGKGQRKSNNNSNMKDKNAVGKSMLVLDLHQQGSVSHNQIEPNKLIYQVQDSSQDVKCGLWACQRNKHCWRCNLKFGTAASFLQHSRVHCHRKPFYCRNCFCRFSRKMYLRLHLRTHKP